MRKKSIFLAAIVVGMTFASCADDDFMGNDPSTKQKSEALVPIEFGSNFKAITRGDIYGQEAANLLGNNFYVAGTKGTEGENNPAPDVVFNNYLVRYEVNSAGKTESNTANWEYVGIAADDNHVKLSPDAVTAQTIKYWDYSTEQYDFLAFSTGTYKALKAPDDPYVAPSEESKQIYVTAMKYGEGLASDAVAYTFDLPSINALKSTYITDIKEVKMENYGKEVQLQFKNLGSKVRVALYETVPGYSVQAGSVRFYTVDGTTNFGDAKGTPAALISENESSFANKGKVEVYFHNVGTSNHNNDNYDKASATVTVGTGDGDTKKEFGNLASDKYAAAEGSEAEGSLYLGRTLPTATFAGNKDAAYYQTVFPVSTGYPLTLRVDYTLISTDGQGEVINVKGAKAVVPSTYTKWLPNYAYTYIFKISDNTNGYTGTGSEPSGLFPITFDAVVAEATDAQGEQTTVTTVATPSITTYQQGHKYETDEYDNGGEKLYVRVMDNSVQPAKLIGESPSTMPLLNTSTSESTDRSLLFAVSDADATEAKVMDALQNRTTGLTAYPVKGRNNLELTKSTYIANGVTSIVNGVDDNSITVAAGTAAEIDINHLSAGTYAYVYDYTSGDKTTTTIYQPISVTINSPVGDKITGTEKNCISTTTLSGLSTYTEDEGGVKGKGEAVDANHYIYFSKTTNGSGNTKYSFVSVDGKERVPAGLLKVDVTTLANASSTTTAVEGTFYFTIYTRNTGNYAVKIIKVI